MTCPSSKCVHTSHLVEPNNASIYFQMSTQPVPLAAKVRGSSCPQSLTWQLPNIFYHLRKHVFLLCGFYFNGFNSLILGASCLHSCELSAFSAYIFFPLSALLLGTLSSSGFLIWSCFCVGELFSFAPLAGWLVGRFLLLIFFVVVFYDCLFFRQNLILHCRLT